METAQRTCGRASWFHDTAGETHAELREALEDSRGNAVAPGLYPPFRLLRRALRIRRPKRLGKTKGLRSLIGTDSRLSKELQRLCADGTFRRSPFVRTALAARPTRKEHLRTSWAMPFLKHLQCPRFSVGPSSAAIRADVETTWCG